MDLSRWMIEPVANTLDVLLSNIDTDRTYHVEWPVTVDTILRLITKD